ncbi:hypothetical protein Sfum_2186 [Syntrophobacter fumaroxidans MPOB]|uniref:Glycosyltransferase RgtA/B/C/D-like domain-containing protein n=2 Tax=Syntrophobacter TaxID=29526 RepID=A0LKB6_SYNFM|nr:hypothetical protein Sfum_2186 [Syntrophobacter fumaroxidans MPOB]
MSSCMLACLTIFFYRRRNMLSVLLLAFFFITAGFAILNYLLPIVGLTPDAVERYIPWATAIAAGWQKSILQSITSINLMETAKQIPAYTVPLAILFYLFDYSILCGYLLSTIFGILCIYELYHIAEDLFDERTAKLAAFLLVCSPLFCLLSTMLLRDTMTLLFILWFFRLWLLHDREPVIKYRLLMIFSLGYAGLLRPAIIFVILFSVVCAKTIFNPTQRRGILFRITALTSAIVVLAFIFSLINKVDVISQARIMQGVKYSDIEAINARQAASADAGSAYAPAINYGSFTDILQYLPLLIVDFMGGPFPWQVKKVSQGLAMLDSGALWLLYLFFLPEMVQFFRRNRKWGGIIFSYLVVGVSASAALQSNLAAAQRHRLIFTVIILPLAAHGIAKFLWGKHRAINRSAWGAAPGLSSFTGGSVPGVSRLYPDPPLADRVPAPVR